MIGQVMAMQDAFLTHVGEEFFALFKNLEPHRDLDKP